MEEPQPLRMCTVGSPEVGWVTIHRVESAVELLKRETCKTCMHKRKCKIPQGFCRQIQKINNSFPDAQKWDGNKPDNHDGG